MPWLTLLGHDRALLRQEVGTGGLAPKWGPVLRLQGRWQRAAMGGLGSAVLPIHLNLHSRGGI